MHRPLLFMLILAHLAPAQERLLFSFEEPDPTAQARGVRLAATAEGATRGRGALGVEFLPGMWPNVNFPAVSSWDWSGFGGLAFDLTNPGPETVAFGVRVDDDPAADGSRFCRQAGGAAPARATRSFVLPLGNGPARLGMRGLPRLGGLEPLGLQHFGPLRLERVTAFQLFLHQPQAPVRLILDNVRLVPWEQELKGIVDACGQFAGAEWPGKVGRAEELVGRARAERLPPPPSGRDAFGGWLEGPTLDATGRFRTTKFEGKWWLVTPEGRLFFSLGACCVRPGEVTLVEGREELFAWLPGPDDPLARHFGTIGPYALEPGRKGRCFDFHSANLQRKFGPDYSNIWFERTLARLVAWGFNTLGNWSDRRIQGMARMVYTATAGIGGGHARIPSEHAGGPGMHDPFDPAFARSLAAALEPAARSVARDPWCLGWFVDNELDWGGADGDAGRCGLGLRVLALDAGRSPAKRMLADRLRQKYATEERFAQAWGVAPVAWPTLEAPFRPAGPATRARRDDLRAFGAELARAYFGAVRSALARVDPGRLYLGCRFAGHTPEALAAAAAHSDVLTFNIYAKTIDRVRGAFLEELDRPALIGEFHFGALDRGLFHPGLVPASDQAERGACYRAYVESVLDHPCLVGCHWFQWVDEPLTGRWFDGENYNIGLTTVADDPYPELTGAARAVHEGAYRRRLGKE